MKHKYLKNVLLISMATLIISIFINNNAFAADIVGKIVDKEGQRLKLYSEGTITEITVNNPQDYNIGQCLKVTFEPVADINLSTVVVVLDNCN